MKAYHNNFRSDDARNPGHDDVLRLLSDVDLFQIIRFFSDSEIEDDQNYKFDEYDCISRSLCSVIQCIINVVELVWRSRQKVKPADVLLIYWSYDHHLRNEVSNQTNYSQWNNPVNASFSNNSLFSLHSGLLQLLLYNLILFLIVSAVSSLIRSIIFLNL